MGSVHLGLTMKFFALAFFVAAASAKDIRFNVMAPPTELEYGFCDGSPTPLTFDVMSVAPFPIMVSNGASITLEVQITLNEEVAVGAQVDLNIVLEGIIPIKIPCPDILLPFLKGAVRAEATVTDAAGATVACVFVRA